MFSREILCAVSRTLSTGTCSTVTGGQPTCYLYQAGEDVDYELIAECVNSYLDLTTSQQTAILCDWNISPRLVAPLLARQVILYDSGVETFDMEHTPSLYTTDLATQRVGLLSWLECGGTLVTHDKMFRGCEAHTVIFISSKWAYTGSQRRSGFTRAVSELCLVTSHHGLNQSELRKLFNVINV